MIKEIANLFKNAVITEKVSKSECFIDSGVTQKSTSQLQWCKDDYIITPVYEFLKGVGMKHYDNYNSVMLQLDTVGLGFKDNRMAICGGYLRDLIFNNNVFNDIDVYVETMYDFLKYSERAKAINAWVGRKGSKIPNNNFVCDKIVIGAELKVDVIHHNKAYFSCLDFINHFDFTINCIGTNGNYLFFHKDFIKDNAEKNLVTIDNFKSVQEDETGDIMGEKEKYYKFHNRIEKFIKLGYKQVYNE